MVSVQTVETWTLLPVFPKVAVREAIRAEQEGWTGVLLPDSQNLAAELIVEMALCAAQTERILIAPGVTNSVTRHPAVLASAMATLQAESGGRTVLEIGRGDSALAHLGFAPMKLGPFQRYLSALRAYLHGEETDFDPSFVPASVADVSTLGLGQQPKASSLRWLRETQKRVPIGVAATGPKVIAIGAALADGVSLSVGADPGRVAAAIDRARKARVDAGLDPADLRLAAFVNIAVLDDVEQAASITAGKLASFSRFSVMHGTPAPDTTADDQTTLKNLRAQYNMVDHGKADTAHAELPVEFAQRHGVIGSPQACLEKLWALRELGITRFFLAEDFARTGASGESHDNLVRHVLPELNSWT